MKKKTLNFVKMGAMGCAAMIGISAASLPVDALASAPVSANVKSTFFHEIILSN